MGVFKQALLKIENTIAYILRDNKNYYRFGENDSLLNDLVDVVNNSGTARACITKLTQFTQGNGLIDQALGSQPANLLQSYNSVISDLSLNVSYFKAVSFRVLINNEGGPGAIYPVPTQMLRRVGRKGFIYNELIGARNYNSRTNTYTTLHRAVDDRYLQVYDPHESPASRLDRRNNQLEKYGEQYGDIIYHFKKGVGLYHDLYPVPDYFSGVDDIESDAGVSRLELRNIKKGWRAQVVITGGDIDDTVKDDEGKTAWDYFSADMKSFTGEDASTIVYIPGATNEAKPTVTVIPVSDILNATAEVTERVGRKVCRHMGVPPILVGFETAGKLGDVQELANTMDLFKMTVIESQDLIKEALRIVYPDKNWDLTQLTLFQNQTPAP
jgi:hypothetical protein